MFPVVEKHRKKPNKFAKDLDCEIVMSTFCYGSETFALGGHLSSGTVNCQ